MVKNLTDTLKGDLINFSKGRSERGLMLVRNVNSLTECVSIALVNLYGTKTKKKLDELKEKAEIALFSGIDSGLTKGTVLRYNSNINAKKEYYIIESINNNMLTGNTFLEDIGYDGEDMNRYFKNLANIDAKVSEWEPLKKYL